MNPNRKRGVVVGGAVAAAALFLAGFGHGYRDSCAKPFGCEPRWAAMAEHR